MASGAGNSSMANHVILRRTSHLKRTATMDTMTSFASTSSFSLRGSFKGVRRTENLMKLISREKKNAILNPNSEENSIYRVRLSNNFAKEHYDGIKRRVSELRFRPPRQSSLTNEYGNISNPLVNGTSDRAPMTLSRHQSLTSLQQDKRRRSILRRYTSLTKNLQNTKRNSPFYSLKESTSFASTSSSKSNVLLALLPPAKSKALERFRHSVRILRILIRAVTRAKDSAKNKFASIASDNETTVSSDGVQDVLLLAKAAAVKNSGLVFDPSLFKANKERQISSDVKRILRLPPSERQEVCIQRALLNLRNAVDAFCEFPLKMQLSLVKIGWYESFEAKRVIIRQGYPAERYYFIVSGTAMVSVIKEDRKTKKCTIQPKALLRKGNSIGEDALMRNDLRDSTVIAETTVEVLMIEKDDFVKIYLPDPKGTEPDLVHFLRVPVVRLEGCEYLPAYTMDLEKRVNIHLKQMKAMLSAAEEVVAKHRLQETATSANGRTGGTIQLFYQHGADEIAMTTLCRKQLMIMKIHIVTFFMQIQKLEEGATFGVLPIVFPHDDDVTYDVTLVSDGAECIMIARRVYSQHLTENFIKFLQNKLRPWPTGQTLQKQLREKTNWQQYKCNMMNKAIESFSKLSLTDSAVNFNSQKST